MFVGLMVGTTGLMEGFNWVADKCTVYDFDDDCLSDSVDCKISVSVYHRNNPVPPLPSRPVWNEGLARDGGTYRSNRTPTILPTSHGKIWVGDRFR